jgi:type IV pilus assembly protein PilA
MQETLKKLRRRVGGDHGFTMIELLVVVVIIGILVAIAVPVYLNYRKGAANKSAMADVRGAIATVEQYYTDNGNKYPSVTAPATGLESATAGASITLAAQSGGAAGTISVSPGNKLRLHNVGPDVSYIICGFNADGGAYYRYDSSAGGSVVKISPAPADLATCTG